MPVRVLAAVPCLLVLLSGCFGSGADGDPADARFADPLVADLTSAPAGCSLELPVVLHKAGGIAAAGFPGPRPVGCLHMSGFATFEPAIGVLSDGTVLIGPGAAAPLQSNLIEAGVVRTRDQGVTWDLVFPDVAGTGESTHQFTLDPYLYTDPETDRTWYEDLMPPPNYALNSWTDDGGDTWTHGYAGGFQTDHVAVFTGAPVVGTTIGYPNVLYRCAISAGVTAGGSAAIACQKSIDGGLAWLPPGEPAYTFGPGSLGGVVPVESGPLKPCWSGNGHGFADPAGRVYLPRGHCGSPMLAWSDDEGLTWERVQVSDIGNVCAPDGGLCEHDAGVGVDAGGVLYYVWAGTDRLLHMVRSWDRGATWDEPLVVSAPGIVEATHVQLAAGGDGRIAFVYYGSANSPGEPWSADGYDATTWNAYMAVSYDADGADPTFATVVLNDPAHPLVRGPCGPVRCDNFHDYIDIRIGPDGAPWAPIFDDCTGPCESGDETANNDAQVGGGRLWNVGLWDDADPNGPFP
jgi:hypothetical protein